MLRLKSYASRSVFFFLLALKKLIQIRNKYTYGIICLKNGIVSWVSLYMWGGTNQFRMKQCGDCFSDSDVRHLMDPSI